MFDKSVTYTNLNWVRICDHEYIYNEFAKRKDDKILHNITLINQIINSYKRRQSRIKETKKINV